MQGEVKTVVYWLPGDFVIINNFDLLNVKHSTFGPVPSHFILTMLLTWQKPIF